ARLMLEAADVLVLDEPTNDLDIASLEVLEESLEDFPGAIILVTHDRAMLARLSTHLLALDGRGGAAYFAGYEQWEAVVGEGGAGLPRRVADHRASQEVFRKLGEAHAEVTRLYERWGELGG